MSEFVKRFYKTARATEQGDGYGVALDARTLKTPSGAVFVAPTRALAEACAAEWDAVTEHIIPARMPLTQFSFASIDHTPRRRPDLIASLAAYIETDLIAHRASAPLDLAAAHAESWDPIVAWGQAQLGVRPAIVTSVTPAPRAPENVAKLAARLDAYDDFHLTAAAQAITGAGSALIGLALIERHITGAEAFRLATIDEAWSLTHWGEDEEARRRLDRQQREFAALERYLDALAG